MSSAVATAPAQPNALPNPEVAAQTNHTNDGSSFANGSSAVEGANAQPPQPGAVSQAATQNINQVPLQNGTLTNGTSVELDIICGPLLNYRRLSDELGESPTWHGSVLIVTKRDQAQPELVLKSVGATDSQSQGQSSSVQERRFSGEKLYHDNQKAFFRFSIDLPVQAFEANWQYSFTQSNNSSPKVFTVPSKQQSMRILFHSCNGFSVGTDEDAWSGPALWNDVMRTHEQRPFHVMIGGGDQIYNDNVRVGDGPLQAWTEIANPRKRRDYPFSEELRAKCDQHYYDNYIRWYGMEPFKHANCVIPQLNIWDDHDIIDGFGSYTDHFMRCHVFRGIGGVAYKYYMLFQHHLPPPGSTFTTANRTTHHEGGAPDPIQADGAYYLKDAQEDPSYIVGSKPGPYVEERSRSIYCQLGARIGFVGLDARMERTRHQINYPETYNAIFDRLDSEYTRNTNLKHLVLLLGVPIAYPRLIWLENIFTSPVIAPIRFLNKRFGFAGGLFNKFDGQVDLLDDLDDHYTARQHKKERRELVQRLQAFSKKHSVRVTILGGDVHLAAIGRFYSKPKEGIPAERDWRYMVNIISSAITNKPPPATVANLLARRNKVHHLDHDTDETLLELFDKDPGRSAISQKERAKTNEGPVDKKTSNANKATMPSRNYAIIEESHGAEQIASAATAPAATATTGLTNGVNGVNGVNGTNATANATNGVDATNGTNGVSTVSEHPSTHSNNPNMRKAIHDGEKNAGTEHAAASGLEKSGLGGHYGLDVTLRVEISNKDREGKTEGYGLTIPELDCRGYAGSGAKW